MTADPISWTVAPDEGWRRHEAAAPCGSPTLSVVIPAHNEAEALGRTLAALLQGSGEGEFDVTVVCNGCTDRTADVARAFGLQVRVLETEVASKAAALNLGDASATAFPRLYLDADVMLTAAGARAMVAELSTPGVLVACPTRAFDFTGRSWAVRAYYRVWRQVPGVKSQVLGAGAYALSAAGRRRFDRFPDLQGDDYFIASLFGASERRTVGEAESIIRPASRLSDLVRTRKRVMAGNAAVRRRTGRAVGAEGSGGRAWWRQGLDHPGMIPSVAVYGGVNLAARLWAALETWWVPEPRWERDDRSRTREAATGR